MPRAHGYAAAATLTVPRHSLHVSIPGQLDQREVGLAARRRHAAASSADGVGQATMLPGVAPMAVGHATSSMSAINRFTF